MTLGVLMVWVNADQCSLCRSCCCSSQELRIKILLDDDCCGGHALKSFFTSPEKTQKTLSSFAVDYQFRSWELAKLFMLGSSQLLVMCRVTLGLESNNRQVRPPGPRKRWQKSCNVWGIISSSSAHLTFLQLQKLFPPPRLRSL